jgi:hypothetical protein
MTRDGYAEAPIEPGSRPIVGPCEAWPAALDHALETAALRDALHVHALALGEDGHGEGLADLVGRHVLDAEFADLPRGRQVALLELPEHGAGEALFLVGAEPELHGGVTVALARPHLGHRAGTRLDHGHRNGLTLVAEDLGHADLLANQSDHGDPVLTS